MESRKYVLNTAAYDLLIELAKSPRADVRMQDGSMWLNGIEVTVDPNLDVPLTWLQRLSNWWHRRRPTPVMYLIDDWTLVLIPFDRSIGSEDVLTAWL